MVTIRLHVLICTLLAAHTAVAVHNNNGGGNTACDMCGASATYTEAIDSSGTYAKRTITSSGCPNHYNVCTGKGFGVCGAIGVEGTGTEGTDQGKSIEIPASPVIATSTTDMTCSLGAMAIALNGVSIYSGAVDDQCTQLDVDATNSEWTSFDFCSGHAAAGGDYHYHFPPSCLLAQIGDLPDGHSPQIGWSYDGFPIYGPKGPSGVSMTHSSQGCSGTYCLDACSGLEMELPSVDNFMYRYYITGDVSDLVSLPGDPKPASTDAPITIACYKGCTYAELTAGNAKCTGGSTGVATGYSASAHSGVVAQFDSAPSAAQSRLCAPTETSPSPPSPPPPSPSPPPAAVSDGSDSPPPSPPPPSPSPPPPVSGIDTTSTGAPIAYPSVIASTTATLSLGEYTYVGPGVTQKTRAFATDGLVGPTIRISPGDTLTLTLNNNLAAAAFDTASLHNQFRTLDVTNLHTHGLHIPGTAPGDSVFIEVAAGASYTYSYDIPSNHMGGTFVSRSQPPWTLTPCDS